MSKKREERAARRAAARERARTPERPPDFSPDPEYWAALGQSTEAFALAEAALFVYFIRRIRIDLRLGKALFGGAKCDQLFDLVRKSWQVAPRPDDEKGPLDDLLVQFKAISQKRNQIIHNRSRIVENHGRVTSNSVRVYRDDQLVEERISPTLLYELTTDLGRITYHLTVLAMYAGLPYTDPDRVAALAAPELHGPWHYKRPVSAHTK